MTTKAQKPLVARMIDEILVREGHSPVGKGSPSRACATASSGDVDALEAYLNDVAATHAEEEQRARREYVEALRSLAPPRTGPAPPPDAHALTEGPTAPPPTKEALAALLRAVAKTPDDLRADLDAFVRLRDKADVVATMPALLERTRELDREIDAVEAEFLRVQAEFAARRGTLELERRSCELGIDRAARADHELAWDQHLEEELLHVRRNRPHASCLIPGSTADNARTAWNEALEEVSAILHDGSPRLAYLERVFFPPLPLPDEPPQSQPIEWATFSRDDS
jgi:hypothetical protein